MLSLLGDFFNTVINTLFRSVHPAVKITIVAVAAIVAFYCLAKTFRISKRGGETKPFHLGYFLTCLLFLTIAVLYLTI